MGARYSGTSAERSCRGRQPIPVQDLESAGGRDHQAAYDFPVWRHRRNAFEEYGRPQPKHLFRDSIAVFVADPGQADTLRCTYRVDGAEARPLKDGSTIELVQESAVIYDLTPDARLAEHCENLHIGWAPRPVCHGLS